MKIKTSTYGLLILVVMVVTRAFLMDDESVSLNGVFNRGNEIVSAYSESSDLRSETYSVQNLLATANSIVFDGIDYTDFASEQNVIHDFSPVVAAINNELTPGWEDEDLLAMNDIASSDGAGLEENLPIEMQLFAPSQKLNRSRDVENEEFAELLEQPFEEEFESIPLDGENTINEQMSRLFPRR
jgi:hypothetical protein